MMNTPQKSVLVTGATGFVGRHLLQALIAQVPETQPIALVRNLATWKGYPWTEGLREVEILEGSVTEPSSWINDPRLKGLQGIFHLAAVIRHSRREPDDMYRTNVEGLEKMVRLAHAHKCRLIFVSTSGTVGCFRSPHEWADEESPYREKEVSSWPYYDSKIRAEKRARELAEALGVELVIVRPPVLLGPGDHRLRSTSHILRMLQGRLPFLIRGGIHFVDIRDATQALLHAMTRPNPRQVYHLSGTSCSIDCFFQMVEEVSGVKAPKFHLPAGFARFLAKTTSRLSILPDPVVFEMASRYWNVRSRYSAELDFAPRDPRETLADTVKWLRENGNGSGKGGIAS